MRKLEKGGRGIRSVLASDEVHRVAGETPVSLIDDVVGPARRIPTADDGTTQWRNPIQYR